MVGFIALVAIIGVIAFCRGWPIYVLAAVHQHFEVFVLIVFIGFVVYEAIVYANRWLRYKYGPVIGHPISFK